MSEPTALFDLNIVIPTYQRCASLERVLAAIAVQQYSMDRVDVIVVSDGSTDGTAAMVRRGRYPFRLQLLEQSNQGPAAARNLALRHVTAPIVLFLDDDVIAGAGLLSAHLGAHRDAPNLGVIGTLLPPASQGSPWIRHEAISLEKQYDAIEAGKWEPGPRQFYTGNASVPLDLLRQAGGFDTSFRRAEDIELAFRLERLGMRFRFCRAAAATHVADRPFNAWLKNARLYGQADAVLGLQRDQRSLLESLAREFHERHIRTQRLVRWGLKHRRLAQTLPPMVRILSQATLSTGARRLSYMLCSGVFNLAYWRGLAEGLGGPKALWDLVETS